MTIFLRIRSAVLLFVLVVWVLAIGIWRATAQTGGNGWGPPLNLSLSGLATAPILVTDEFGGYHAIWQDQFAGYVYASYLNDTWSEAVVLKFPFSDPPFSTPNTEGFDQLDIPVLATDSNYLMHAAWVDNDGLLWYSHAVVSELQLGADAWTAPLLLSGSVRAVDITPGTNGRLHLSYIYVGSSNERPAGVYYLYSDDSGNTWSNASLVYQSEYLRSIDRNNTFIDLVTASDEFTGVITTTNEAGESSTTQGTQAVDRVHIAWADPGRDTILTARSIDGSDSWEAVFTLDSRNPNDPAEGPSPGSIRLFAQGDELHVTWQASHEQDECTQYDRYSSDKGQNWQPPQITFSDTVCPTSSQFIYSLTETLFLLTTIRGEVYLQVWDGLQWSESQLQEPASYFTDPQTYRLVELGCQQTAVTPANELLVVGCGSGTGADIWAIKRPLGELADWSPLLAPVPVWSQPQLVASSPVQILPPHIVVGSDGRLHAFWGQETTTLASGAIENTAVQVENAIYYARLDEGVWSAPRPVLTSPEGKADHPTAISNQGLLFVAWSGGQSGGLYFSRALADRAASITEWSEPQSLPALNNTAIAPDMKIDRAGTLFVAYSIPLNEHRGIYLTKSSDNGATWSEPVRVFDGVVNNWQMVGIPHLAMTENSLHLLWTRQTLPMGIGTLELFYTRSEDRGETWTEPQSVVQGPALWSDIVGIGERTLHRVWLGLNEGQPLLWHQISADDGLTWNTPVRVSDSTTSGGVADLMVDIAGEPHLFQLVESNTGQRWLQEWLWDGARWQVAESADLGELATDTDTISAVAAPHNILGVMYTSLLVDPDGQQQNLLSFTQRNWEAPDVLPTPLPTLTPTPLPTPTETPPAQPTPTPTLSLAAIATRGVAPDIMSSDNPTSSILLGLIPSSIVLLLVVIVAIRAIRAK